MANKFRISGFKCFYDYTFDIRNITVLCGSNGTGKSSFMQALLLLRLAIERNLDETEDTGYTSSRWAGKPTPLNLGYELALGTVYNVFRRGGMKENTIVFKLDDELYTAPLPNDETEDTCLLITHAPSQTNQGGSPLSYKEFYYLNAERLGPRHELRSNYTDYDHCGHKGEFTAKVLRKRAFFKVSSQRTFEGSKSPNLEQQVDAWLDYICPGTMIKVEPLGLDSLEAQIRIRNSTLKNHLPAPYYGFGVSYALPIVVTGLIAKRGRMFLVENPEAHLHPKAQSNIGFFLGKIAADGVKVVIETHSEHIINGIRRAMLSGPNLNSDDVVIYFFNGFQEDADDIVEIKIDTEGNLIPFPRDFFDQTQQDMAHIFQLLKDRRNG